MSDTLRELSRPFPERFIHGNPSGGGSYIKHHVIEQRMIEVLGVPPHFTLVELLRGDVAGYTTSNNKTFPDLTHVIVGVVARMQVEIDGAQVIVDECGDCEQPHNWKTDGQRLKDAMSDAYKRCAMRLGVGLHLWSQDEFFLFDKLSQATPPSETSPALPADSGLPESEGADDVATAAAEAPQPAGTPASGSTTPAGSPPIGSEEEQLEAEQILGLLKDWVGGNDSKHSRVRAEVAKASLEQSVPPPEIIANASLPVLRAVASVLLTKAEA